MAASVLTTVAVSSVIHKKGRLDMVSRGLLRGGTHLTVSPCLHLTVAGSF